MKTFKQKSVFYLSAVLFSIFLFSTMAYSATITFFVGDVTVARSGKTDKAVFQMELKPGDIVKTGNNSLADISYESGTVIKVKQNSTVKIGSKNIADSDSLSLTSGIVQAKFAKIKKDKPQKLYTPTTVCAVRGTTTIGGVGPSGSSFFFMEEGTADISNSEGTQTASAGDAVSTETGGKPLPDGAVDSAEKVEAKTEEDAQQLDGNPEEKLDQFQIYLNTLNNNSASASKDIADIKKTPKPVAQENLDAANLQLEKINDNVEDELYMNEAASNTIEGILDRFKKDRQDMYNKFMKIKLESNKVLEQQKKNYAAIQAIKEAYRKAKEDILNKNKNYKEQIKGSYDKEKDKVKGSKDKQEE